MKELLDKFYAGTATPEEEARLLDAADTLPAGPDRDLLQALAAMRRQEAISRLIDEAAAAEATPQRRTLWPYWVSALAMAACILLLVLPREAAPLQMAENRKPAVVAKPQPTSIPNHSNVSKISRITRISTPSEEESSLLEPAPLPVIPEEEPTPIELDTPAPELLYAETLPDTDTVITLTAPTLIARAGSHSSTLIACATPATDTPHPTPSASFSITLFGHTLGDTEADPFASNFFSYR